MLTTRKLQGEHTKSSVRAACDTCHETKSRCARVLGSFECERCSRLGKKCSYSAPLRMGRPKDKGVTQSSGSSLRDHSHLHPHNASTQRKRQRRAAQKSGENSRSAPHRDRETGVQRLNTPDSGPNVIQIDDSQHLIGDTWLSDNWAGEDFDLTSVFEPEYAPQLCQIPNLPGSDFGHLDNPSAFTLHNPDVVRWPIDAQSTDSTPVDISFEHQNMSSQSPLDSTSDIYEDCLHRLLRLQSDLCKTMVHAPSSNSRLSLLSEDHPTADKASSSANASPTNPDMVLRNTQTLIDILQLTPPSSPLAPHTPHDLDPTSQLYINSSDGPPSAQTVAPRHNLDSVVTLLSLSCYATLLVAYDSLVASLITSGTSQSDTLLMQPHLPSPSLTLGTFSITARSSLFASTVLHVVKQLMEELQSNFRKRFPVPDSPVPEPHGSMDEHMDSASQPIDARYMLEAGSCIVTSAYSVLRDISGKEKNLMELLAGQR